MNNQSQSTSSEQSPKNGAQLSSEFYPGICNLCTSLQHRTIDCCFSTVFYHATNLSSLDSIMKNGLHGHTGRLGKAIYCSDDPSMCIRYVLKNGKKFRQPILLRMKVMITHIHIIENREEIKNITNEQFKSERIQCVRCPYFTLANKILYQFALFDIDYTVVGWSRIKLPIIQPMRLEMKIQKLRNHERNKNTELENCQDQKIKKSKPITKPEKVSQQKLRQQKLNQKLIQRNSGKEIIMN